MKKVLFIAVLFFSGFNSYAHKTLDDLEQAQSDCEQILTTDQVLTAVLTNSQDNNAKQLRVVIENFKQLGYTQAATVTIPGERNSFTFVLDFEKKVVRSTKSLVQLYIRGFIIDGQDFLISNFTTQFFGTVPNKFNATDYLAKVKALDEEKYNAHIRKVVTEIIRPLVLKSPAEEVGIHSRDAFPSQHILIYLPFYNDQYPNRDLLRNEVAGVKVAHYSSSPEMKANVVIDSKSYLIEFEEVSKEAMIAIDRQTGAPHELFWNPNARNPKAFEPMEPGVWQLAPTNSFEGPPYNLDKLIGKARTAVESRFNSTPSTRFLVRIEADHLSALRIRNINYKVRGRYYMATISVRQMAELSLDPTIRSIALSQN